MMVKNIFNHFYLFLTATCIGVLAGLSVSPVIQTIITAILGLGTTIVSVWMGLSFEGENKKLGDLTKLDLKIFPLTLFVLGITLGSLVGIYMRTHDVLGKYSEKEQQDKSSKEEVIGKHESKNSVNNQGDKKQVDKQALNNDKTKKINQNENNEIVNKQKTVLFKSEQDICDIINSFEGKQLIYMLQTLGNDEINIIIKNCNSDPNIVKQKLQQNLSKKCN